MYKQVSAIISMNQHQELRDQAQGGPQSFLVGIGFDLLRCVVWIVTTLSISSELFQSHLGIYYLNPKLCLIIFYAKLVPEYSNREQIWILSYSFTSQRSLIFHRICCVAVRLNSKLCRIFLCMQFVSESSWCLLLLCSRYLVSNAMFVSEPVAGFHCNVIV